MITDVKSLFREIMSLPTDEEKRQGLRIACKDLFFLSEAILRNEDSETIGLDLEYHGEMCSWLTRESDDEGKILDRKLLLASRGTLKSTVATRNYVVWRIIKDPNWTMLIVSATLDNSKKKLRAIAEVFERNDMFRWIFPELIPEKFSERWTQTSITVPRKSTAPEGTVEVQGYESELTSRHYDEIIDDDVVGKENSGNREQINKVKNYYTQSLQLLKKPYGRRLIIGTLWNYMDLYNHILENLYNEYDFYIRSCWKNERYLKGSDGKWRWVTISDEKESVYPALMPVRKIEQIKKELESDPLQGLSTFKAQYEMKIVDDASSIFPRQTYIDQKPVFKMSEMIGVPITFSLSCDPAVSEAKEADETSFTLRAVDDKGIWYIWHHMARRGMKEEDIVNQYIWYLTNFPIALATIETVAFQKNLKYAIEKRCLEEGIYFPYYALPSGYNSANKNTSDMKIRGLAPFYATGKIKFLVDEDGVLDAQQEFLLDQMWRFPKAEHDDRCLDGNTLVATIKGDKKIKYIVVGDRVVTPSGVKRVLWSGCTGYKEVIDNLGITGTKDHKIFNGSSFDNLDTITYNNHISKFNLLNQIIWKYKRLLYLMEYPTRSWEGRESIISVNQEQVKGESVLRDCMSRFGNFIIRKGLGRGLLFITRMVIALITTLTIWSAYKAGNIYQDILKFFGVMKNIEKMESEDLMRLDHLQKGGINQKKVSRGTKNIIKILWGVLKSINIIVKIVIRNLRVLERFVLNIVQVDANKHGNTKMERLKKRGYAKSVAISSLDTNIETQSFVQENVQQQNNGEKRDVYNIEVEDDHCFYANGVLVSNCDSLAMHLHMPIYGTTPFLTADPGAEGEWERNLNKNLDRYGNKIEKSKPKSKYI